MPPLHKENKGEELVNLPNELTNNQRDEIKGYEDWFRRETCRIFVLLQSDGPKLIEMAKEGFKKGGRGALAVKPESYWNQSVTLFYGVRDGWSPNLQKFMDEYDPHSELGLMVSMPAPAGSEVAYIPLTWGSEDLKTPWGEDKIKQIVTGMFKK